MNIEKGAALNVELVGYHDLEERPGFQMAIQKVGDKWYLYLGHFWHSGWTILEVTDPANPRYVKFVPGPEGTETIKVQVAEGIMVTNLQRWIPVPGRRTDLPYEEGILIWDVKDPENPKHLGHWKTGVPDGTHRNYYGGGRYVHCAASAPGFYENIYRIVDIADPANPVEAGRWWLPEQWTAGGAKLTGAVRLHGPAYPKGNLCFLGYGDAGLLIVDISDVSLPKFVGHLPIYPPLGRPMAVHTVVPLTRRDLCIISSEGIGRDMCEHVFGMKGVLPVNFAGMVDVADPTNPTLISLFPTPVPPEGSPYKNFHEKGGWFGPHNWHEPHYHPDMEDRDDRAYLTSFNAGLRVYDISDPYLPKEIAYYVPPDPKKRLGPLPKDKLVVSSEDILVDKRGYIYVTDKNLGLHILRCTI